VADDRGHEEKDSRRFAQGAVLDIALSPVLRAVGFIAIALALCAAAFALAGFPIGMMAQSIVAGAVGSPSALQNSLRWALPLLITSLGVVVTFKCGFFNVGAQGQFYIGAIGTAFVCDALRGAPAFVVIPLAIVAAIAGGACWALWPGVLRVRWHTDEVITTLMGNFIATLFLLAVVTGPLKDPAGTGQSSSSRPIDLAYRISESGGVSLPIIAIALAATLIIWLLMNRTAFGVLADLAGRNPVMMSWLGADQQRLGLIAFAISGGLAGLAGAVECLGPNGAIIAGFLPVHGFTAILIALVGNLTIVGDAIAALFFGGLAAASVYLPILSGLPSAAIDVINATIALFITARVWPSPRRLRQRQIVRHPEPVEGSPQSS
jgi:ABC-type uncharacterized transport system permease subunit